MPLTRTAAAGMRGTGIWDHILGLAASWRNRTVTSPGFQRWASRFFLTRPFVKRDAAQLYDLVAGFVYSQVLLACMEMDILRRLSREAATAGDLAGLLGVDPKRVETLLQAAASIGLLQRLRDGRYRLDRLGAAALGVPGLEEIIRHNAVFYRDMADPVALIRGSTSPELARFWPYVRSDHGGSGSADAASTYSRLMAASQALVAEETLLSVSLSGISHLIDVGGGTGTFLSAVNAHYPDMDLTLFDLPPVIAEAGPLLAAKGLSDRIQCRSGDFLKDLPQGSVDAVSLVRVLYDHDDSTVEKLLESVMRTLSPGGLLLVSEPMSGGSRPSRSGDAYFGFYTMAMTTGTPRAPERHQSMMERAGFQDVRVHRNNRPFVTRIMTARKPRAR